MVGDVAMEYKRFIVKAFEREPGKWRASVERANGKVPLKLIFHRRRTLSNFVTGIDAKAVEAAMRMAIAAFDDNAFSRISNKDELQSGESDGKLLNPGASSRPRAPITS